MMDCHRSLSLLVFACGTASGLLAPLSGCGTCPVLEPASEYEMIGPTEPFGPEGMRFIEDSGHLTVTDTSFLITYETEDGTLWEVEYARIDAESE